MLIDKCADKNAFFRCGGKLVHMKIEGIEGEKWRREIQICESNEMNESLLKLCITCVQLMRAGSFLKCGSSLNPTARIPSPVIFFFVLFEIDFYFTCTDAASACVCVCVCMYFNNMQWTSSSSSSSWWHRRASLIKPHQKFIKTSNYYMRTRWERAKTVEDAYDIKIYYP